jgi:hypothetical protein
VLGVAGMVALGTAVHLHRPLEATLLRARGAPFVVDGDLVRNTFEIHVVNKRDVAIAAELSTEAPPGADVGVAPTLDVAPLGSARTMLVVRMPRAALAAGSQVRVRVSSGETTIALEAPLLGPLRR